MQRIVHIQKAHGEWANHNAYIAMLGFWELGYEVRGFDINNSAPVGLSKETPVVAGVAYVRHILKSFLGEAPPLLDYPESLVEFLGRDVRRMTAKDVRRGLNGPVFVKPLAEGKSFTGRVIRNTEEFIELQELSDDYGLWISDVLDIVSEWRVYVTNGEIQRVCFYNSGDCMAFPSAEVIRKCVDQFANAPAGYALDVGVTSRGDTILVEVNDGYSLGNYGLTPIQYATLLEARWDEMMSLNFSSDSL